MNYARVTRDGFRVPLIGIDDSEVLEQCDGCREWFDLLQIRFCLSRFFCDLCLSKIKKPAFR